MPRVVLLSLVSLALLAFTAPADADPPADRWHLEAGVVAGYESVRLTDEYDPFDWEDPEAPTTSSSDDLAGASGVLELSALWRATEGFAFGPFVRAGAARSGQHFTSGAERRTLLLVGPALAVALSPTHDLELQMRGGFAMLDRRLGAGFAAGLSFGLTRFDAGQLRLGFEGSGVWTRDSEDADFGRYTYSERLVGVHLSLGFRI